MNMKKIGGIIFVFVCVLVLVFVVFRTFFKKEEGTKTLPTPPQYQQGQEGKNVFPTKTPEEVKIISNLKTEKVEINDQGIQPKTLTVGIHDQIVFFNQSSKTIRIKGADWGNVPLLPKENMTQSFNKAGVFTYAVEGLASPLSGEVIVK